MVSLNGYTTTPNHRQNRRRERPGSRTRRTITRKSNIQYDCYEGLLDARDSSVALPSDRTKPSPLFRQSIDQNWARWQAKKAEEKSLVAEIEQFQVLEREQEQLKLQELFGGDVDDDELYRMGILWDEQDNKLDNSTAAYLGAPKENFSSAPTCIIKLARQSRRSRRQNWRNLPLYLSLSDLSHDADIARLISPSGSHKPTIQHRDSSSGSSNDIDIPLSLPPNLAALSSTTVSPYLHNISNTDFDQTIEDWTFLSNTSNTIHPTPSSEPETWILLNDDS